MLMPNIEAWNPAPPFPSILPGTFMVSFAMSTRVMQEQEGTLNALKAEYAQVAEQSDASSPEVLELRAMLQKVRGCVRYARSLILNAIQHITHLRVFYAATWRLLLTMLANGGPRKDPPLGVYETLCIPEGVPPWSPWIGLSPPVVPALIQRQ
jgi:hypothetical protein